MRFDCAQCLTRYTLPEERVRGKVLRIRCKDCGCMITVTEGGASTAGPSEPTPPDGATAAQRTPGSENASEQAELSLPPPAPAPAATRPEPVTVGQYRIVRKIGEGATAVVYECVHQRLGRQAAVKILRPEVAKDEEAVRRFFSEARAASMLQHEAVVQVLEFGFPTDGGPYLLMELVRGQTLEARLRERGPLPLLVALDYARQLALVLQAVHEHGIVHRERSTADSARDSAG